LRNQHKFSRIALLGISDLAEIASICAIESDIKLVAVVDPTANLESFYRLAGVA